jgi:ComF family protein
LIDKIIKYMKDELKKYKKEDFLIISPPMSFFRKLNRWYNHSEILWKNIANYFWFSYETKLILKAKHTRQQSKLNRQDRLLNLKKAFKIDENKVDIIDNKIIILIDDVISTWTTINEISKILRDYKPRKIIVVTIASGY